MIGSLLGYETSLNGMYVNQLNMDTAASNLAQNYIDSNGYVMSSLQIVNTTGGPSILVNEPGGISAVGTGPIVESNFALENCMTDEWEESSSQLKEAIRMLVQQVRRLEVLNRGNEKLLKNALGYVQFTLKVLNATSSKDPVQLKEALPAFSKPSSKFVNQVV